MGIGRLVIMRILVLGTGMMGGAAGKDIARFGVGHDIGLADHDEGRLSAAASAIDRPVDLHRVDCEEGTHIASLFSYYNLIFSCMPYRFNTALTEAAIDAGAHFIDLGGNSSVVRAQLSMNERAASAGVAVIPDCGLAPGLSNIFAMAAYNELDRADTIDAWAGGLPRRPRPPLGYQLVFSVEGLLNEYLEDAEIIEGGRVRRVESLTGLEPISFGEGFGELEAFYTSGGLSLLPEQLEGKVDRLAYRTIRYRGHCERFRMLLDLGFASREPIAIGGGVHTSRELFGELLRKKLSPAGEDLVLLRVDASGMRDGTGQRIRYEMTDYYDAASGETAMMRTTAFSTSIIALMVANGEITGGGVRLPHTAADAGRMIEELKKRGITVLKTGSDIDNQYSRIIT
jgi:lysine 6-dehydrogenase